MSVLRKLENAGKRIFAANPGIKKAAKSIYQRVSYIASPKLICEGNVRRVSPDDGASWFFGYYDKSPWDASGERMLCLRAKRVTSPAGSEPADIMLIENGNARRIVQTHTWNTQQGCMAQWMGPGFDRFILYNDLRNNAYCAVIFDTLENREIRVLDRAAYAVSQDGSFALSLDFSRLHRLRPGYGYSNLPDATANESCPDGPCVWRTDLKTGESKAILNYCDLLSMDHVPSMDGASHKVNHIMISPNGTRVMLLHRWYEGQRKHSRLITMDPFGQDRYVLSDEEFVSHCNWKNDSEILGYMRRNGKDGYYLLKDKTKGEQHLWPRLESDGHMGYASDGKRVVTDCYPNNRRVSSVYVISGDEVRTVARVFSPFKFDGDLRCDLHPRWDRGGTRIAFDSTHEGVRGLYVIDPV